MPTFSTSLEKALHQALTLANERHHEYATLEDVSYWDLLGIDDDKVMLLKRLPKINR